MLLHKLPSPVHDVRIHSAHPPHSNLISKPLQQRDHTIETPGWSSLVESNTSELQLTNKTINSHKSQMPSQLKSVTAQDILQRLMTLHNQSYEEVARTSIHKQNQGTFNPITSKLTEQRQSSISKQKNRPSIPRPSTASSSSQIPRARSQSMISAAKQQNSIVSKHSSQSRFKEITVHEHLYLDSKKLETKKMVQKIMDQQLRKETYPHKPAINPVSQQLAEQRYRKLQADPFYRCYQQEHRNVHKEEKQRRQSVGKVKDKEQLSEIQFRCLHWLFFVLTGATQKLNKETMTVEEVPLPCLRSIQKILEGVFLGKTYSWIEFLEEFYKTATNRKTFFTLASEWMKRRNIQLNPQ